MHTGDIALALIAIACACLALAALLASLIDRAASSTGARTRPRSQAQDTPARPGILRQATALAPILAGALTCIAALLVLASGDTTTATFFPILPNLRLEVTAAPLGAAFWLLIGVPLLASGISDFEARRQDARARAMDNLLLLVLLALVSVGDGLSFLILWQSVLTLVLVPLVFQTESRVALGRIVALLMAGTSMLPVFLLLDAGCHTLRLAALRACGPHIDPAGQSLLFILILAASASMALLPRATGGAWADPPRLILAGAVPPYALLRILPAPGDAPGWWGLALLALGAGAAVAGTMAAVGERSLARLPAHASLSQGGIVLLGLGSALLLHPGTSLPYAATGIEAAMLCAVGGTWGSSLLWIAVRAMQQTIGSDGIERMGGLLRAMPWAGTLTLVGMAGALILPTLGGLGGGWLTIHALIAIATTPGSAQGTPLAGGLALLCAVALGLAATLGIAAAVLAYGLAFLGPPRTPEAAAARDCPPPPRAAMALLALPILAIALVPSAALALLHPALVELTGATGIGQPGPLDGLRTPGDQGTLLPWGVLLCVAICAVAPAFCTLAGGLRRSWRERRHTLTYRAGSQVGGHDPAIRAVSLPSGVPADLASGPLRVLPGRQIRWAGAFLRRSAAANRATRLRDKMAKALRGARRAESPRLARASLLADRLGGPLSVASLAALLVALLVLAL